MVNKRSKRRRSKNRNRKIIKSKQLRYRYKRSIKRGGAITVNSQVRINTKNIIEYKRGGVGDVITSPLPYPYKHQKNGVVISIDPDYIEVKVGCGDVVKLRKEHVNIKKH